MQRVFSHLSRITDLAFKDDVRRMIYPTGMPFHDFSL